MYPDVFLKFAKARHMWGDLDVLPTRQFFYGLEEGEEVTVELEPGKTLFIRLLTVGDARPDGYPDRLFRVEWPAKGSRSSRQIVESRSRPLAPRPIRRNRVKWARPYRGGHAAARKIGAARGERRAAAGNGSHEDADDGLCSA